MGEGKEWRMYGIHYVMAELGLGADKSTHSNVRIGGWRGRQRNKARW